MEDEKREKIAPPGETVSSPVVRIASEDDLPQIRAILETWIRDQSSGEVIQTEVDEVIGKIRSGIDSPEAATNIVAEDEKGHVVGVMGLYPVSMGMLQFVETESPREINNAYVASNSRGLGIGGMLVARLESVSRQQGITELIINSGPRYKKTGWDFWRSVYGSPIAQAEDYYGPGLDALVWRKNLGKGTG